VDTVPGRTGIGGVFITQKQKKAGKAPQSRTWNHLAWRSRASDPSNKGLGRLPGVSSVLSSSSVRRARTPERNKQVRYAFQTTQSYCSGTVHAATTKRKRQTKHPEVEKVHGNGLIRAATSSYFRRAGGQNDCNFLLHLTIKHVFKKFGEGRLPGCGPGPDHKQYEYDVDHCNVHIVKHLTLSVHRQRCKV